MIQQVTTMLATTKKCPISSRVVKLLLCAYYYYSYFIYLNSLLLLLLLLCHIFKLPIAITIAITQNIKEAYYCYYYFPDYYYYYYFLITITFISSADNVSSAELMVLLIVRHPSVNFCFKSLLLLQFLFDNSEFFTGETRHIVPPCNKAGISNFYLEFQKFQIS